MRNLLLVCTLFLLSVAAVAQVDTDTLKDLTPIPAEKIAAAAKPFLGTFDGINCVPDGVIAVRLQIQQSDSNTAPFVTLLQIASEGKIENVTNPFETIEFSANEQDTPYLFFSNGAGAVMLMPYKDTLIGIVVIKGEEQPAPLMLAKTTGELLTFMTAHSDVCTSRAARSKFIGVEPAK